MAANVQVGLFFFQNGFHFRHVMARIASDVGHVDINILDVEKQIFGILQANNMVVDVAVHCTQWLEVGQGLSRLEAANVTRVPQLVNVFEEIEELRHEGTMCVR